MIKIIKENYKLYLLALIIAILMFSPYIIFNKGIILAPGDPYELNYKLWLGGWTQFHNGDLGQFNWSLGLGANTFSYAFYFLTNPLFWISLLLPREFIKYSFLIFAILQLTLGFIATHIWLTSISTSKKAPIIGAFIIGFGAYGIFYLQAEQFLKCLFFYPLILYFTEKYLTENKILGLTISIGILGISQFFLLYQFIPFLFLYTLFRYLIIHKANLKFKDTVIAALKYAGLTFLGIGLAMFVILPCAYLILSMPRFSNMELTLLDHIDLKQFYEVFTGLFTPTFQKLDANFFINANNHNFLGWAGTTIIYCLIITPMLVPLIGKIEDQFTRNIYLLFTGILLFFLCFTIFSYIFQANIDTRWFYMFYLLFVMIDAKVIDNIEDGNIDKKYILYTGIMTIGIIIICLAISAIFHFNTLKNLLKLSLSSIIIICFVVAYIIYFTKQLNTKILIGILSLESIYCGIIYFLNNTAIDSWVFDLPIENTNIQKELSNDKSFYRVLYDKYEVVLKEHEDKKNDVLNITTANEPLANGYAGMAFYESIYNTNQEEFLNRFKSTWNMPQSTGRNKVYNLLSAKYFYTFKPNDPVPYGYKLIREEKGYKLYENENFVELGFTYDKTINKYDIINLSFFEQDRIMQEYLITENSNNHEYTLHDNIELLAILPTDTTRVYEFEKPVSNINLYFETFGIPNVKITTYLNNKVVNNYDIWQFNYVDIPIYENIDKVVIEGEDIYGNGTQIYMYQEPLDSSYNEAFDNLTKEHFTNVIFDNDYISADITINDHNKYIFTSIPYDAGWSVKVNGEEIPYEKVQLGFIGFNIDPGTYHIEFTYEAPLLKEGIFISISSLVIILIINKLKKNPN